MPNPWTEAWEEAEVTAPPEDTIYTTLEIQHPSFLDSGSPPQPFAIRIVNNVTQPVMLGIEDSAQFNPGESVEFSPIAFWADHPEFEEGRVPEVPIVIDNVARELLPAIMRASEYRADLIILYREYSSEDTSEPIYGPIEFKVQNVSIAGSTVRGTARLDNLNNKKFPRKVYTVNDFPALLG